VSRIATYAAPFALAAASLLVCAGFEAWPSDPRLAAAVFPPWWSAGASLSAGAKVGAIIGRGAAPFIVLVRATDPDVTARARAAGALFVIDSAHFGLCLR